MASPRSSLRDQLMHTNGTSPHETITIIVPSLFYTTITTIIVSLLKTKIENLPLQFCIEFATLVLPIILNVTVLADHNLEVLTTSFIICLSVLFCLLPFKPHSPKSDVPQTPDLITNSRSTINIISVVAILAVDFLIFPRRFAKTETFGHSLMDVGVGLFVFSNGIVDGGKTDLGKALKGSIPLFVLGGTRFVVTRQIDYHVPVSEYGVHWNFFITLAVTKIFVSLIFTVVNVRFIWINATLLMISHEVLLQSGLANFVMKNTKRKDFVSANKEGLVSSVGYVYLYLFSAYFSYFVGLKRGKGRRKTSILKFVLCALVTLVGSMICQNYFGISRKLANPAYCFWVLFIGTFMTGLYYVFGRLLEDVLGSKLHVRVQLPFIFRAINYNGLTFFLVSNLLTGVVNMVCDTLAVGTTASLVIICVYMFINCSTVCVLYKKQMKLKF
ncbi:uncharacterized protein LOC135136905 [Zophobas morio]|uniref:uncharacterized protein LOC135136905 n=1 Tax=Zophobas morio TaxID=2755281 RepID=UPI0030838562